MATLLEVMEQRRQARLAPLPALPGGAERALTGELPPDPTADFTALGAEGPGLHERVLPRLISIARHTGIPQALGMTFDGIQRVDAAFRMGVLTARGAIAVEDFPRYWREALTGRRKLSNHEFMELFTSRELMYELDRLGLPGWTKKVVNPLPHLAGEAGGEERIPRLSAGSLLSWTADFWASPFALLSLLPPGAGLRIAKAVPVWSPFARVGRGLERLLTDTNLFGEGANPLAAATMYIREFQHTVPRPIYQRFVDDRDEISKNLHASMPKLHDALFLPKKAGGAGPAKSSYGALRTQRRLDTAAERNVMKKLFRLPGAQALAGPEQAVYDDLLLNTVTPYMTRLADMGFIKKGWKPEDGLMDVFPSLVDMKAIPMDVLQSWSHKTLGLLGIPLRSKGARAPAFTDENLDLATALRDFVYAAERKLVWNKRIRVPVTKTRMVATGLLDQAGNPILQARAVTRYRWESVGSLRRFKPAYRRTPTGIQQVNPHLAGTNQLQRASIVRMMNEIQGKARGREVLNMGEVNRRFFTRLKEGLESNRVTDYFWQKTRRFLPREGTYDFPEFTKPQIISQFLTHNVVRAMLGLNLGAAIKNTSQLLNTATVHGVPATLRGMWRMSDPNYRALAGREVSNEFRRILTDEKLTTRLGDRFDNIVLGPFQLFENFARGTTFNVALDHWLKKRGFKDLLDLQARGSSGLIHEAIRYSVHESLDANFIYGVLGRPASFLGSPVVRPVTTLLSYGPKQLEFYARTFKRDGSAFVRALALNGFAISQGNKYLGIAPESWLGYGFLPPLKSVDGIPLVTSPQVQFTLSLLQGFGALASGRPGEARDYFRESRGQLGPLLDLLDLPLPAQVAIAGSQQTGVTPVALPIMAIARTARAGKAFFAGIQESQSGETHVKISRADALRSAFFQTTLARRRSETYELGQEARDKVDAALDRRVRSLMKALDGRDGQALSDAARELASPISITRGLGRPVEAISFTPHIEMIEERLQRLYRNRYVSQDVQNLERESWLREILWAHYLDLFLKSEVPQ